MDPTGQAKNLTGAKRKSRFEDDPSAASHQPEAKKPNLATNSGSSIDISAAAARAAEISRELAAKVSVLTFSEWTPFSQCFTPCHSHPHFPFLAHVDCLGIINSS